MTAIRDEIVTIAGLEVSLRSGDKVVEGVDLRIGRSMVMGLVGESGSGKTTVAQALLGVTRPGARITAGSVIVDGVDVRALHGGAASAFRGRRASYVAQDPGSALDPLMRIGKQLEEMVVYHLPHDTEQEERVVRYLELVHLPSTQEFRRRFPHQLSGGQQQRLLLAMALICSPTLIVLDEPTTGLDATTQAQVLQTVKELCESSAASMLYVTHDLGVISRLADSITVMYGGRIVESGSRDQVIGSPAHPYTQKLLAAVPRTDDDDHPLGIEGAPTGPGARPSGCPFHTRCELATAECRTSFPERTSPAPGHVAFCYHVGTTLTGLRRPRQPRTSSQDVRIACEDLVAGYRGVDVLEKVSFAARRGECLAIVGESGSGKSTLARAIMGLVPRKEGSIVLDGRVLSPALKGRSREEKQRLQIVFQNADSSLNPRLTISEIVGRPAKLFHGASGSKLRHRVDEALELVRLDAGFAGRRPPDLSGGEKQRVAIARALAAKPDVLVCDEVTSALDVSVQAAIVELLEELRVSIGITMLFISHNLAVVRALADQVLVLEAGAVRELSTADSVFNRPESEYSQELLRSHRAWSLEAPATKRA